MLLNPAWPIDVLGKCGNAGWRPLCTTASCLQGSLVYSHDVCRASSRDATAGLAKYEFTADLKCKDATLYRQMGKDEMYARVRRLCHASLRIPCCPDAGECISCPQLCSCTPCCHWTTFELASFLHRSILLPASVTSILYLRLAISASCIMSAAYNHCTIRPATSR